MEIRIRMFKSSINRRVRRFYVVCCAVDLKKKVLKSVMQEQSCWFIDKTNCFLTFSFSSSLWLLQLPVNSTGKLGVDSALILNPLSLRFKSISS